MFNTDQFVGINWIRGAAVFAVTGAAFMGCAQSVEDLNPQNRIALVEKVGESVPLDTPFMNEDGKTVKLSEYFGERPVILMLMFYQCNGSCMLIKEGAVKGLGAMKYRIPGKDYELVAISIHPKETPELAKAKKAEWLKKFKHGEGAEAGVHFLTGKLEDIQKVTDSVGYTFHYNEQLNLITHPATLVFITPKGRVSSYISGVTYPQRFVMANLDKAAKEIISEPEPELILWGCLQHDPRTGKTTIVVERVMKVMGMATLLVLFGSIIIMSKKHKRQPLYVENVPEQGGAPDSES
ncbi:MAG: SCO family protein [Fimbriimonadaceae bacterium]|nr:SCO family protein [Fimbriimonadaceae bacterium]